MNVYGVRWGLLNILGLTLGGIQWIGPSQPQAYGHTTGNGRGTPEAQGMAPATGAPGGREERHRALPAINTTEKVSLAYDLRGATLTAPVDLRGILVDILV
ncbi:MAG: hypothetical protein ACUVS3_02340 [Thermodesulfobacteriota bacterium]